MNDPSTRPRCSTRRTGCRPPITVPKYFWKIRVFLQAGVGVEEDDAPAPPSPADLVVDHLGVVDDKALATKLCGPSTSTSYTGSTAYGSMDLTCSKPSQSLQRTRIVVPCAPFDEGSSGAAQTGRCALGLRHPRRSKSPKLLRQAILGAPGRRYGCVNDQGPPARSPQQLRQLPACCINGSLAHVINTNRCRRVRHSHRRRSIPSEKRQPLVNGDRIDPIRNPLGQRQPFEADFADPFGQSPGIDDHPKLVGLDAQAEQFTDDPRQLRAHQRQRRGSRTGHDMSLCDR